MNRESGGVAWASPTLQLLLQDRRGNDAGPNETDRHRRRRVGIAITTTSRPIIIAIIAIIANIHIRHLP